MVYGASHRLRSAEIVHSLVVEPSVILDCHRQADYQTDGIPTGAGNDRGSQIVLTGVANEAITEGSFEPVRPHIELCCREVFAYFRVQRLEEFLKRSSRSAHAVPFVRFLLSLREARGSCLAYTLPNTRRVHGSQRRAIVKLQPSTKIRSNVLHGRTLFGCMFGTPFDQRV